MRFDDSGSYDEAGAYDEAGNRITLPGAQGPYFSAGVLDPPKSEQVSEPEQEPAQPTMVPPMAPTMAPPMARKKQKVERSSTQTGIIGSYTCTECKTPKPSARSYCQNTTCGKYKETKTRRTSPGPPRPIRCKLIIDDGGRIGSVCGKTKTHSRTRCACAGVKETEWREKNPEGGIRREDQAMATAEAMPTDEDMSTDDTQLHQPFEGAQLKSKYKKKKKTKKKKKKKTKQRKRKTK